MERGNDSADLLFFLVPKMEVEILLLFPFRRSRIYLELVIDMRTVTSNNNKE